MAVRLENIKVGVKITGGFLCMLLLLALVALAGRLGMQAIDAGGTSIYERSTLPIQELGAAQAQLFTIRGDVYRFMLLPPEQTQLAGSIAAEEAEATRQLDLYGAGQLTDKERAALGQVKQAWPAYENAVADLLATTRAGNMQAALAGLAANAPAAVSRNALDGALMALIDVDRQAAEAQEAQNAATYGHASLTLLAAACLAALLAVGLGLLISRNITRPLALLVGVAENMALGDLNRGMSQATRDAIMRRQDEIGELGRGFGHMFSFLREVATAARTVAAGDLTVELAPRSEKDELGEALATMLANLRTLVGHVANGAALVGDASTELAAAAEEAGASTSQVNATIQQVTQGSASQAGSTGEVTAAMNQINANIASIAGGTQQQAEAVQQASASLARLSDILGQVVEAAETGDRTATRSVQAAASTAQTVRETIAGMGAIQESTRLVKERMQEMAQRSEQIGQIVSTIQDIADQTNLLALNAAIEAARAGEQGRGFAVVAEEVRKLAEKSGGASREIADLVRAVQRGTEEAAQATAEEVANVERGQAGSARAGEALAQIVEAAQENREAVARVVAQTERMQELSHEMVRELEVMSSAGAANAEDACAITRALGEVSGAAETVAAAAQENSASMQEISATAQELTAQIEELSAESQELAALAEELRADASTFVLPQDALRNAAPAGQGSGQALAQPKPAQTVARRA
jgi:methyl-accepting chemotaxis protein